MVTSIASAITEILGIRDVAMTGEVTLRGVVLPIGGLKENFAAQQELKKVLIPFENKKDLTEIPETKKNIEIIPVQNVEERL